MPNLTNILLPHLLLTTLLLFSLLFPPAISTVPSSTLSKQTATITQLLRAHNAVRARHSLPPLKWSVKLANYAKWYANQRRGDCALVHSPSDYGENIFWGQGSGWRTTDAVAAWAAQEAYYDYGSNTCMAGRECLHYTQIVWRSTRSVGCARIKCRSGDTFVVCEYDPHGNVIGQRPY